MSIVEKKYIIGEITLEEYIRMYYLKKKNYLKYIIYRIIHIFS